MNTGLITAHEDESRFSQALFLATNGMQILPVHGISADGQCTCGNPGCLKPGKHPVFRQWQNRATTDLRSIEAMDWQNRNIGMLTGTTRVVLDCDGATGVQAWDELAARNHWNESTTKVRTGSGDGRHIHFKSPAGPPLKNRVSFIPSLDFRGHHGMVVMPNSSHISGGTYEFEVFGPLAPLPQFLVNLLRQPQPTISLASSEVILFRHRNDTVFRLASSLRGNGAGEAELRERLTEINLNRCSPPLDGSDIQWIIKSVMRYQPNKKGMGDTMLLQALSWELLGNRDWKMEERIIANTIVRYSNAEGRISYATIRRECGIGNVVIEKAIRSLVDKGDLLVYPSPKRGRGQTPPNAYKFTNPAYSFFLFHKPQLIGARDHLM